MRTALCVLLLLAVAAAVQAGNGNGLRPCSSFDSNFGDRCRACGGDDSCKYCVQVVEASGAINALNAADRCKPNNSLGRKCVRRVTQAAGHIPVDPTNFVDRCRHVQCDAHITCLKNKVGGDAGLADDCVRDSCGPPAHVCDYYPQVCHYCDNNWRNAHACKSCLQYYYSNRGWTSYSWLRWAYYNRCKRAGGKKGM